MKYTDEHLSAFLDGQLSDAETTALETELETNIKLAEHLASLVEANEAVKAVYNPEIDRPVSEHIQAMLAPQTSMNINDNGADNVVPFSPPPIKLFLSKWGAPLAASFAMMIGMTVGRGMTLASSDPGVLYAQMTGVIAADNPLFEVLETAPSATNAKLGKKQNLEIRPILTFISNDGSYCREFKTRTQQSGAHGVACREGNVWNVLMLNQTERSNEDDFRTASGGSGAAIDQFIDGLLVGAPFDADAELKTIKNEWKK